MKHLFISFMLIFSTAYGDTIFVPKDYQKIQDAIDAAQDGDEVLVSKGTYLENISFKGKAIRLRSRDGAGATVIDGQQKGSVVVFGQDEKRNSVIEGFTLTNGLGTFHAGANKGGGILCIDSSPTIMGNIISKGTGYYGGGICCYGSKSKPIIEDCVVIENEVTGRGGGIFCDSSDAYITGCTIKNNSCIDRGGGIGAHGSCSPIITGNHFDSNTAVSPGSGYGGGIGTGNGVTPLIHDNIFINNIAFAGAGMSIWGGEASSNVIMYNTAKREYSGAIAGHGGGIQVLSSFYTVIKDNLIASNSAMSSGGGIIWGAVDGIIDNNIICNNIASGGTPHPLIRLEGGGIRVDNLCKGRFSNNLIYDNLAGEYGGGVSINEDTTITIINSVITNNDSPKGAGIYCYDNAELDMTNSIVWENQGPPVEYELIAPVINYSDIQGGWQGTGNIDKDPCFVDANNGDFHLLYQSPCRNAGDNSAAYLPTLDFEGDPRIAYGTVDMGADEFYTHLYYNGDTTPGGSVELKFIDLPGASPVGFWIAFNALEIPIPGAYGDWWLLPPMVGPFTLPPIPSNGVYVLPGTIPVSPPGPYSLYLQALVGMELTNMCEMQIK